AVDVTDLMKALPKCSQPWALFVRECDAEKSDHLHRRPLRPRRERPRCRRAAKQRDELAPSHSITSSERACSVAGISISSALATFKLMTSSNVVGCITGSSSGLAPLRIRPA